MPFDNLRNFENINPKTFWLQFTVKIFAIVPHAVAVEHLFSSLGLTKTKLHNKISSTSMGMLGILYHDLHQRLPESSEKKTKAMNQVSLLNNTNITDLSVDLFFEEEEELFDMKELKSEIEAVDTEMNNDNLVIKKFFDLEAYE
ncbi:1426_t:CDS:2 [Gigaspora margarita]|uniref:1426_t:CDS:1 n=1 Tax=Gigaspora margarita TaxID=4874 RepID=A0ABN7WA91_GIGMA|nr:1426_t:CDS:2 [Gigaspora margarita]